MDEIYKNLHKSIGHLEILNSIFKDSKNYSNKIDFELYRDSFLELSKIINKKDVKLSSYIYGEEKRQMILSDVIEYIFFARGFYFVSNHKKSLEGLESLIKIVLHFVNLLMLYETLTVDAKLRQQFLKELSTNIKSIKKEGDFTKLFGWKKAVGLAKENSNYDKNAPNKYFDTILPKTSGGLWHELLVYVFLIRFELGHIFPLLLHQKILSGTGKHITPPDFILMAKDKKFFGIEVGRKKEIQSGKFSLETGIPTVSVDTENSRVSDRCPICNNLKNAS